MILPGIRRRPRPWYVYHTRLRSDEDRNEIACESIRSRTSCAGSGSPSLPQVQYTLHEVNTWFAVAGLPRIVDWGSNGGDGRRGPRQLLLSRFDCRLYPGACRAGVRLFSFLT